MKKEKEQNLRKRNIIICMIALVIFAIPFSVYFGDKLNDNVYDNYCQSKFNTQAERQTYLTPMPVTLVFCKGEFGLLRYHVFTNEIENVHTKIREVIE